MKQIIAIIFLLSWVVCFSQHSEFEKSGNGLIYSDSTINQLKFIVDSLNLKFKACEPNKTYLAKSQTKAHFVSLKGYKAIEALKDLSNNISFEEFTNKYELIKIKKELLIVKFKYKNYYGKDVTEFNSLKLGKENEINFKFENDLANYDKPLKGKWIYKYNDYNNKTQDLLIAFYFLEEFSNPTIPEKYARMIQYSDCMIDTTTLVFYENARKNDIENSNSTNSKIKLFKNFTSKSTDKPEYDWSNDDNEYKDYQKKIKQWDTLRFLKIDSIRKIDRNFDELLNEAIEEAFAQGGTDDEFEEYVGVYYSKKTELELKRKRLVVGGCSADDSPRIHALNIAKLSAETVNWEIFLRSHLDIMNDRFSRKTDGSYEWGRRKTYIKELEVLDINVLDLLLGICLRIENPSQNHYFGNIGRIGRALSETIYSDEIEEKMLSMISDNQLDDYNRILIYYLYLSYIKNLDDKEKQKVNKDKLEKALKTLPEYLSSKIFEN